ncbi:hypothetical protein [Burkholderia pseudomallei]
MQQQAGGENGGSAPVIKIVDNRVNDRAAISDAPDLPMSNGARNKAA